MPPQKHRRTAQPYPARIVDPRFDDPAAPYERRLAGQGLSGDDLVRARVDQGAPPLPDAPVVRFGRGADAPSVIAPLAEGLPLEPLPEPVRRTGIRRRPLPPAAEATRPSSSDEAPAMDEAVSDEPTPGEPGDLV